MNTNSKHLESVLAVFPMTRGYACAYFEGPNRPIDWATSEVPGKAAYRNSRTMWRIERLLDRLRPDRVVLEDCSEEKSPRGDRIRDLTRCIEAAAVARIMKVDRIPRDDVQAIVAPAGQGTRYEIAVAIAKRFPEFGYLLPDKPQIWESEGTVMGIFAAAALIVTHYDSALVAGTKP